MNMESISTSTLTAKLGAEDLKDGISNGTFMPVPNNTNQHLVGVINESTSTVSFSLYTIDDFKEVASHSINMPLITPKDGWFEQDPMAIINKIYHCAEIVICKLPELGYRKEDIITIGITNQRETTVVWDAMTGRPLHNAIVWNDIRTTVTVDEILSELPTHSKDHFKNISGLPISPYFSALKIRWLKDNIYDVRKACRELHCKAGTIDSWIIWHLTKGHLHITDVTNASRTMLMNIRTLQWDETLLEAFGFRRRMLPQIRSCSEIYGKVTDPRSVLYGMTISGIIGNQQASLLGQMCIHPGQTKNSYRSGCFLLCNTGPKPIISEQGLLTTVAYKLGPQADAIYALEGAIAVAGHALEWLENKVRLLPHSSDSEKYAEAVPSTEDVYFVPAFTGLYAPYWCENARGLIVGLTHSTRKHHLVRAVLESICFQTRDILECIYKEADLKFTKLHADGALSSNTLLMQLQADIAGVLVLRSQRNDTANVGTVMCAAHALGKEYYKFENDGRYLESISYDKFMPITTEEERTKRYGKWKKAIRRSFNWANHPKPSHLSEERRRLISSIPGAVFLFTSFAIYIYSMRK